MMSQGWLRKLGQGLGVLGAGLFAVSGLRLMTVAVAWAVEARSEAVAVAPPARERIVVSTGSRVTAPVAVSARPAEALPTAEPLRLMLAISAGAPRSEVYVNGARLGLSPYLGDFTCKRGEKLKIEIVPARGALVVREATCEGKTLRIQD